MPEVNHIIKSWNYPDVVIKGFHSSCTGASLYFEKINEIIGQYTPLYSKVIFIGSSCFVDNKKKNNHRQSEFIQLDQCFELLVNKSLIYHLIGKKYYLVSNGWLRDYKKYINNWGFDPVSAKTFFNESTRKLILLDTEIEGDYLPQLEALSEYMGLPYEILPVGLSYCRLFLDSIIYQWREENERNSLNDKLSLAFTRAADYALAFNQLNNLIDLVDENEIVRKIFNFLELLFIPLNIVYTPCNNEMKQNPVFYRQAADNNVSPDDNSFRIVLSNQQELIGEFDIIGINFPQYIEKYKEISKIIGSIGGLAVANARKFMIIKEAEKQIRHYSEQLKELIATKDKLFSIIAHDLKGPFQGFLGVTELMAEDISSFSQDELSEAGREIHYSAKKLFKLLNNLLEWARMQRGMVSFNPQEIVLAEIVFHNISLIVKRGKQKGIEIIPENHIVFADEAMLDSILRNLLSNAVKFTECGGKVIVKARESEDNKMVEISVADNGIGMPENLFSKLFKIDEKVGREGTDGESSTGLGLLLCKEFVEKHGGNIWVESLDRKGSTFYFTLPAGQYQNQIDYT
ncbi:MAG: HAMP domain-containing sensor histidine kinase [Ignavibacteria bacterium]